MHDPLPESCLLPRTAWCRECRLDRLFGQLDQGATEFGNSNTRQFTRFLTRLQ